MEFLDPVKGKRAGKYYNGTRRVTMISWTTKLIFIARIYFSDRNESFAAIQAQ